MKNENLHVVGENEEHLGVKVYNPPLELAMITPSVTQYQFTAGSLDFLQTTGAVVTEDGKEYRVDRNSTHFEPCLFPHLYRCEESWSVQKGFSAHIRLRNNAVDPRWREDPIWQFTQFDLFQKSRIGAAQRFTYSRKAVGAVTAKNVRDAEYGMVVPASVKNTPAYWRARQLNLTTVMARCEPVRLFDTHTANYRTPVFDEYLNGFHVDQKVIDLVRTFDRLQVEVFKFHESEGMFEGLTWSAVPIEAQER